MDVLLLGGTGFVGRHLVLRLLERDHKVTLFCRGLSDPNAFADLGRIVGDRGRPEDLAQLAGRAFDVVIDTSGYAPREVRASAAIVARSRAHYVFVSSVSVYADLSSPPDESFAVHEIDGAEDAAFDPAKYGGLKVACERAVQEALGPRALVVRPGRILGPHDSDERFPYVLRRIARGGEVLAPGYPAAPAQVVDARDLAAWIVASAERRLRGVFNAVGPSMATAEVFDTVRAVTGSDARFTWVSEEILLAQGVAPYTEAPFWLPRIYESAQRTHASRAVAEGLTFRPFIDTARDEWAWLVSGWEAAASVRAHKRMRVPAGMSQEGEQAVLAAARERG
jgi:2'-hydroxyisoflavone reductase